MTDPELLPVEERAAVLLVAGLDPSGGAGLLQDAMVVRAFELHPVSALTGIAVQNTERFIRREAVDESLLREQLEAVGEEFLMGAVKCGMLPTPGIVEAVVNWLSERPRLPLVLDPVLRSSSGGDLTTSGVRESLVKKLIPRCRVLTPNCEEAEVLTGREVVDRAQMPEAARALRDLGADWVLVKGGHLVRGRASDFLAGPDTELWLEEKRRPGGGVRGTGCVLATALACGLARGETVPAAARAAKQFLTRGIDRAYVSGKGRFPRLMPGPDAG
jgi:hydroxymethylpyrimidine/phosphomethylpyrimidine kinase